MPWKKPSNLEIGKLLVKVGNSVAAGLRVAGGFLLFVSLFVSAYSGGNVE